MIATLHGDALAKELHRRADELVNLAEGISNLGKPETDNNLGREAMVLRAAACEIDTLVYRLDSERTAYKESERAYLDELHRVTSDRDAKSARMWEIGKECDSLQSRLDTFEKAERERAAARARVDALGDTLLQKLGYLDPKCTLEAEYVMHEARDRIISLTDRLHKLVDVVRDGIAVAEADVAYGGWLTRARLALEDCATSAPSEGEKP